jgi:hypothetical protein
LVISTIRIPSSCVTQPASGARALFRSQVSSLQRCTPHGHLVTTEVKRGVHVSLSGRSGSGAAPPRGHTRGLASRPSERSEARRRRAGRTNGGAGALVSYYMACFTSSNVPMASRAVTCLAECVVHLLHVRGSSNVSLPRVEESLGKLASSNEASPASRPWKGTRGNTTTHEARQACKPGGPVRITPDDDDDACGVVPASTRI